MTGAEPTPSGESATIRAARFVGRHGLTDGVEVRIGSSGLIESVGPTREPTEPYTLVPGLVDLQVNGIGAVHVAQAQGDDWDVLDRALLAQGVTTWCPTLTSARLDAYEAPLERIAAAARRPGPRPGIAGAHLEGPFLALPGAHDPAHLRPPDLGWLRDLPEVVRVVTLAPELPGALDAIELLVGRGVVVALGHTAADPDTVHAAVDRGATLATHLFNAMAPFHHREPGPVGAALAEPGLSAGLIADLEHVHPAALTAAMRAKGPGGWFLVSDQVATGASGDASGEEPAAPRTATGTLTGSTSPLHVGLSNVIDRCGVDLPGAVRATSTTPARLLGLDDRGAIEQGRRADLVALDQHLRPAQVWIGGDNRSGSQGGVARSS